MDSKLKCVFELPAAEQVAAPILKDDAAPSEVRVRPSLTQTSEYIAIGWNDGRWIWNL